MFPLFLGTKTETYRGFSLGPCGGRFSFILTGYVQCHPGIRHIYRLFAPWKGRQNKKNNYIPGDSM